MIAVAVVAAVVCAGLIALAALLITERRQPHPDIAALVETIDRLCDRVQAPHLAGLRLQEPEPGANPPAVSVFDDDEYWESREQLAERLMQEEVAAKDGVQPPPTNSGLVS